VTNNYKYDIGTHIKKNEPVRMNDLELADETYGNLTTLINLRQKH